MRKPNNHKMKDDKVGEFLLESNAIEQVFGTPALQEALEAWEYAFENKHELRINDVLETHFLLLQRIDPDIAGRWRDRDVWIGGKRKRFFHPVMFEEEIQRVLNKINDKTPIKEDWLKEQREEYCKEAHVQFEECHPFLDGNGRVGRILYNVHRLKLFLPIHVIHTGKEQMAYYKWFR